VKSFLRGRINNGLTDVDCLVRDISAAGATLSFSRTITMPAIIDLHIPLKKQTMGAHLDWRNGDEMGVSFIEAAPQPVTSVSRDIAKLTERVLKLEGEFAACAKCWCASAPKSRVYSHEIRFCLLSKGLVFRGCHSL
jgi:hypothetical protein